jgi:hypothetical protein
LNHRTTDEFWVAYDRLPQPLQRSADKAFSLLKENPAHPSLHFKPVGRYWSARLGDGYRAMAVKRPDGFAWFWIGPHDEYMRRVKRR